MTIFYFSVFLFFRSSVSFAQPLNLSDLISEAKNNNLDIASAQHRWEASQARIPQAKSLDDPTVGFTFEKIPRSTLQINNTMPEDRMFSLQQFFPLFGKLSLKGKIALVESQQFAAEYKDKELEIINEVKNAYYDLFMNYKEMESSRESLILLVGIAKSAESRFSVGEISQEEVYKIHLEIAQLNSTIKNLEEENIAKQARLKVLLNRDADDSLGELELSDDISFDKDSRPLYQAALLNQPELMIFSYAIEKNKYAKSLAKRSFFPDLMAGLVIRGIASGMTGPWDLMMAFNVPLWFWTKQRYAVKEAIANLEEAEDAYRAMQNKAFAEVEDLSAKIAVAKNKIKLYKTSLMPLLEGSLRISLAAYASGKGDFMVLLDNQRMLVENKMNYYKALVEYNMYLADLERTVGVNLK